MDSNITINIVEPGSGPVVPNTGLFTSSIGGPEATIIVSIGLFLIIATVLIVYLLHKKKVGRVTALQGDPHTSGYGGKQSCQDPSISKPKKLTSIGLVSLALLASAGTLTTLLANAGKSNTNAIEDGLTLDVTGGDITIELADEPVFAVAEVKATVKEATEAGYTLTAYTDNTDLVSTTNPDNIIPMVTLPESSVETLEPSESTETAGELSPLTDNTYGLALEKPTTKDAEVYMPLSIDSDTPTILKATDFVETEANDTTTIYYGFYITPDVPYGTYTGTNINYNVEPHYITNLSFDGNGNDGGEEIESRIIPAGDTITLPENTYTKEGYNFIGWNTVAEPTEETPGKTYPDQGTYIAPVSGSQNVTLYAQWEEELPVIGDLTYMQDFAKLSEAEKTSVLNSMTEGAEYQLKDNRDQTMYYIAKLADDNIWMTQNLDLDLISDPTAEGYVALTPANTNISSNWIPKNSTISFTGTSVPGWQDSSTVPYSADPGDVYYYTSNTSDNDIQYNSLAECEAAGHTDCAHYHAGNYYNWSAAVASNDTSSITESYSNAPGSVCPAGWRLPKREDAPGVDVGEFYQLLNIYDLLGDYTSGPSAFYYKNDGFNTIRRKPIWYVRSGKSGSSLFNTNMGFYSTSTVGSISGSTYAYGLFIYADYINPNAFNYRHDGSSVRCLVR